MCPKLIELLSWNGPTVHVWCFMLARASTKTFVSRIHIRQPSPKTAKKSSLAEKFVSRVSRQPRYHCIRQRVEQQASIYYALLVRFISLQCKDVAAWNLFFFIQTIEIFARLFSVHVKASYLMFPEAVIRRPFNCLSPIPLRVGFMVDRTLGQIILRVLPINLVSPSFHQCSLPILFICRRLCMPISYTGRAFYQVFYHDDFHGRFIVLETPIHRAFEVHIPFAVQVKLPYFVEDVDPLYDTPFVLTDIVSGQCVLYCICGTFCHCYLTPALRDQWLDWWDQTGR